MVDEATRQRMARGWPGNETPCGSGSRLDVTQNICRWLPAIVEKYDMRSLADLGAGDLNWMSKIVWPEHFVHSSYDLIPRGRGVHKLDITCNRIPRTDLLLCRMVLIHLNLDYVMDAINGMRESGSKYLAVTTWPCDNTKVDWEADFHRINMDGLLYKTPIESCVDGSGREARLALYTLGD